MNILAISDIHDDIEGLQKLSENPILEEIDVLMIAGDLCNENPEYVVPIVDNFSINVIFIRGNHDPVRMGSFSNAIELKYGQVMKFKDYSILGHPYPVFDPSCSRLDDDSMLYNHIQGHNQIDIVLSHAPPYGFFDYLGEDETFRIGSQSLFKFIHDKSPRLVICGHMHEFGGRYAKIKDTLVVNVAPFNRFDPKGMGNPGMKITIEKSNISFDYFNINQ
ncbi:MAG: metallophosphoesterase [Candidatus Heimdallarchaeota archaeon]|nr:metallophosphoesterase [Candidatus Heimdallarchaeota archaeon]MDH5645376.1 metallophosphoesterase [Candidatus Heimdallarchaeota archaeon]